VFGIGSQLSEFFSSLFTPFLAFDFRIMSFNANTNRPVRMLPNFAVKDHEKSAVNSAQLALFHAFLLKFCTQFYMQALLVYSIILRLNYDC